MSIRQMLAVIDSMKRVYRNEYTRHRVHQAADAQTYDGTHCTLSREYYYEFGTVLVIITVIIIIATINIWNVFIVGIR